jgi:peroxiredoxin (alkyl hydroperoxide reductase subunit C)
MNQPSSTAAPCSGLRIGDLAPDFEARSTVGPVRLSAFRGRWLVLFSHPADFTPVCTTEFVALAREAAAFEARDCGLMALSVDSLFSHFAWLRMIRDRFGVEVRFPILEDPTLVIGRAFGMVSAQDSDSATVRTTFFIDPKGVIRAMTCYPANLGRSIPEMLRILDGLQAVDAKGCFAPANWQPGEPMLKPPTQNLDDVFDAEEATNWFLREAERGA